MSMAPKDGNIIKDGIAALLRGLVGSPGDTGGSTTAGTVMAKENEILDILNDYKGKVKNNMILKKTEEKSFIYTEGTTTTLSFSFDKPVKLWGVYFSGSSPSSNYYPTAQVYIINGEDSFRILSSFQAMNAFYSLNWLGPSRGLSMSAAYSSSYETIIDAWITQIDFQFPAPTSQSQMAGKQYRAYVVYQEEG